MFGAASWCGMLRLYCAGIVSQYPLASGPSKLLSVLCLSEHRESKPGYWGYQVVLCDIHISRVRKLLLEVFCD